MPSSSFPPMFHEFGTGANSDHEPDAKVIYERALLSDFTGNFTEVTSWDPFGQAPGLAATGHSRIPTSDGWQSTSSRGFLPITLPDGANLNSLSVMGHSSGTIEIQLISQSLTYPIHRTKYDEKEGQVVVLAEAVVGSSTAVDERGRLVVSGPEFARTVEIADDGAAVVVDNGTNWYGLWADVNPTQVDDKRGYITGVKVTYDEPTRDRWPEKSRGTHEKYPALVDEPTELTVVGPGQSSVGVTRDGGLVELDESGATATTFTLPPGEYEVWTDGDDVELVAEAAPTESDVPPWLPERDPRRDDDPAAR